MTRKNLTTSVFLGNDDREWKVVFNFHPETPDVYYLSNGDPGYPGDPAEVDIITISSDGKPCDLSSFTEEEQDKILQACFDAVED
jgi:hypothetical protein